MTDKWEFVAHIPLKPRPKQRPRIGKHGAFTPKETLSAERQLLAAIIAHGARKFNKPVVVEIECLFQKPIKVTNPLPRTDVDNCAKLCLDALQPTIIADDTLVQALLVSKRYATHDGYIIKIRYADFSKHLLEVQKCAKDWEYGNAKP